MQCHDLLTKCTRVPAHLNHLRGCCACCALHIVANGSVIGSLCRTKRCEQPVTCACSCVAHCSRCRHAAHLAGADHSSWSDTVRYTSGQIAGRAACMIHYVQRSQQSRKSTCDAARQPSSRSKIFRLLSTGCTIWQNPSVHAFRHTKRPQSALCSALITGLKYLQSASLTGFADPADVNVQLCAATMGEQQATVM